MKLLAAGQKEERPKRLQFLTTLGKGGGRCSFSLWGPQGNWVHPQLVKGETSSIMGLSRDSENVMDQMNISFFHTSPEICLCVPTLYEATVLTVQTQLLLRMLRQLGPANIDQSHASVLYIYKGKI